MLREKYKKISYLLDKNTKPLILLGSRQVGKTYILKEIGKAEFKAFYYFNFEQNPQLKAIFEKCLNVEQIVASLEIFLNQKIRPSDLIIFDEIQECPKALTSLKYFAEFEKEKYHVIAAGSLLGVKLNNENFPVGKVHFEYLNSLSFSEFLLATNPFLFEKYFSANLESLNGILHEKCVESYLNYLYVGGMPEAVKCFTQKNSQGLEKYQNVREVQEDILKSYLADFAKHAGKANSMHLHAIWNECARQIGNVKDESTKRFKFQGVIPGKKQFSQFENAFHWLEHASLIIKSHIINKPELPLDSYIKNSLFKCFIFDVGLLNAMINTSAKTILEQSMETYKGFIAENFVAQELRNIGHSKLYTWEGKSSEIEFVIPIQDQIIPIEVKSGTRTRSKSLKIYSDQYSPHKKIIFSLCPFSTNGNLWKVPIYAVGKAIGDLKF